MAMKDNSGIARRQHLRQRLLLAFATSVSFFLGSFAYRIFHPEQTHVRIQVKQTITDPLDEFMSNTITQDSDKDVSNRIRTILSASTNLINIGHIGSKNVSVEDYSYRGIIAEFCPLNFTLQKESPSQYPIFEDIVENSHCGKGSNNIIRVDLKEAVQLAREFDTYLAKNIDSISINHPSILDLKGAVFHESRCGATLAASSMAAVDPTKNRVYSESGPPKTAMKICGEGYSECSVKAAANVMKDVIYMMSRTNDPREENLFFVFQPELTRTMETFMTAFPTTPWIFMYRPPLEAILSQGANPAFSLKSSPVVQSFVKKEHHDMDDLKIKEKYAVHLATFCLSALGNFDDAAGLGLALRYTTDFANDLIDTIFPQHFHIPVDRGGKKRISDVFDDAKLQSQNDIELLPSPVRGRADEIEAPKSTEDAAKRFLAKSYKKLEGSMYNVRECRQFKPSGGVTLHCKDQNGDD